MTGLRPLLRLAWREVTRDKARSALVVGLVALMVGAAVAAATITRTTTANSGDYIVSEFGAADLIVSVGSEGTGGGFAAESVEEEGGPVVLSAQQRQDVVTATETVLGQPGVVARSAWMSSGAADDGPFRSDSSVSLNVAGLQLGDPIFEGRYRLLRGRFPQTDSDVVLTPQVLDENSIEIGETIPLFGREFVVVGEIGRAGSAYSGIAVVSPAGFDRLDLDSLNVHTEILFASVDVNPRTLTIDDAAMREVADLAEVPALQIHYWSRPQFSVGGFYRASGGYIDPARPEQLGTLVAALFAVQVALVAAAAFAVGVARRTRQFGQLQATGANNRQLQQVVLLEAGVFGLLGALLGAVLGVGVAALARSQGWLDTVGDRYPFDVRWSLMDLIGPAIVGVGAAVAAAWWPTRRLRTLEPASALAGHIPVTTPRVRNPAFGLLALVGGTLLFVGVAGTDYLYESGDLGVALMVVAILAMFGGALSSIGVLIHRIGERADKLPLLARLVVRNSARHQSRSWVAVAALVAVVILPVVMGASTKAYPNSYGTPTDVDGWMQARVSADAEIEGIDRFFATLDERVGSEFQPLQQVAVVEERPFDYGPDGSNEPVDDDVFEFEQADWENRGFSVTSGVDQAVRGTPALLEAVGLDPALWQSPDAPDAVFVAGRKDRLGSYDGRLFRGDSELSFVVAEPASFLGYEGWTVVSPEIEERFDLDMVPTGLWIELDRPVVDEDQEILSGLANEVWADEVRGDLGMYGSAWVGTVSGPVGPTAAQAVWVALGVVTALAILISLVTSALAAVEVDREISTMIAAGAPPSIRRRLLGGQTAYHLFVASLLGVPLALLLFWAATSGDGSGPRGPVFPWTSMAVMLFVVPLVVGLAIALVFRNGKPSVSRRLA
jgi:hypothetical protein